MKQFVLVRARRETLARPAEEKEREEGISMDRIIDASHSEEQAPGWSPFLSDVL